MSGATIWWLRSDLRLSDNPALAAALKSGGPVVPVYIWPVYTDSPGSHGDWAPGEASRCWLQWSLEAIASDLRSLGSRLIVGRGEAASTLLSLAAQCEADAVVWNRRYEPSLVAYDRDVKQRLATAGLRVNSFSAAVLHEPHTIENQQGKPFRVFTPFWRKSQARFEAPASHPRPKSVPAPATWPDSLAVSDLGLAPAKAWVGKIHRHWAVGEAAASARLEDFVARRAAGYDHGRDHPGEDGVSRLSPHLAFGEIGPAQVVRSLADADAEGGPAFVRQIYWRDFARHLLFHFPATASAPLNPRFDAFPWSTDPDDPALRAWQRGRTGYPLVDAAMRELWSTGWMHNRARMNVASFLVKHLLIHWRLGARWFWDTLLDADLANNTMGWQWAAGCGADAAPYFRIFNPVRQGERFDAQGSYVRQWVPELKGLPDRWIHQPWAAGSQVLAAAGVTLDRDYPAPIVEHSAARARALTALATLPK